MNSGLLKFLEKERQSAPPKTWALPSFGSPVSQLVNANQCLEDRFKKWACGELGWQFGFNRKLWEYAFILNALEMQGKLGGKGLGFGVGAEPTIPVMLRHGAKLVVTDLDEGDAQARGWTPLRLDGELGPSCVRRVVDMNSIPSDLRDFDFVWSCGALGHIGGLEAGLRFIEAAMNCLRPGGIAVHTTDFKYDGGAHTFESPNLSIYRQTDIEALAERLRAQGHRIYLNLARGTDPLDELVADEGTPWESRIREACSGHVATSVGLIIQRRL